MNMVLKRVYEPRSEADGFRVLVDRLWPRGLSKDKAHIDVWEKNIAPSNDLRKWFNHEINKWPDFQRRYREELTAAPEEVRAFRRILDQHPVVTLLYGAKDEEHNQAVVLRDYLLQGDTES